MDLHFFNPPSIKFYIDTYVEFISHPCQVYVKT